MTLARRALLALLLAGFGPWPGPAVALPKGQSDPPAETRLLDGGVWPDAAQDRLAGIEIRLQPDALTYWRSPGEAGLPPTADFSRSTNLKSAELLFPAPSRYDEAGAEAFGYKDVVIFPIHVVPADPQKPVDLKIDLSFAVCTTLCLPASAQLDLTLDPGQGGADAETVRAALARVPETTKLGSTGALAIGGIAPGSQPDRLTVTVQTPAGETPDLFAEAPEGWFMSVGPARPVGGDRFGFDVSVVGKPSGASGWPPSATFTVVTATRAIEVGTKLDAATGRP